MITLLRRRAILDGERPARPTHPNLTDELWVLMKRCWNQDPHLRPEMSEVLETLRGSSVSLLSRRPEVAKPHRKVHLQLPIPSLLHHNPDPWKGLVFLADQFQNRIARPFHGNPRRAHQTNTDTQTHTRTAAENKAHGRNQVCCRTYLQSSTAPTHRRRFSIICRTPSSRTLSPEEPRDMVHNHE
jgi:hypothetical protein